jgi:hypothetical protein
VDPNNADVHWFNTAAFTQAANGTTGNIGRNTVVGPAFRNFNGILGKTIPFREGMSLQLRMEAYNATNTTNFLTTIQSTSPGGFSLGNSNFGDVTADRGGRVMQFVARFAF